MPADLDAAGNADASGHGGMIADLHVVRDHDLVVQLHTVADQRIGQCSTVDGGVRADLDVVTDGHPADLAIFCQTPFSLAKPKPSPPITAPDWILTRAPMVTSW